MNIASIAQRDVVAVDENATLQEAAQLMRDRHVGALVVTRGDSGDTHLVGLVTDRDIALQVVANGTSAQAQVGRLASSTLVAVPDDVSLAEAAETMRDAGVRRLLLVDGDRQLAGIVTLDDLLAAYADQLGDLADALGRGIEHEVEMNIDAAPDDSAAPVTVPPELASAWRHVVEP